MLGLCYCRGFSPVVASGGYFVVVIHELLTAVASLAEHGLQGAQASVAVAPGLWSTGSVAVGRGVSCSVLCGIFPDQGSKLCLLHWQADSLPLSHQGIQ